MKKKVCGTTLRRICADLALELLGGVLYAVGIYTFARPAGFAPGGHSGLALMGNLIWGLPIGVTTLALNIPLVLISYPVLGKGFLLRTARTMLLCTFLLDVVFPLTPAYGGSGFLAALYAGAFVGAGLSLFYMRGTSSGGTDLLTMTIKKRRPHLSIGAVTMGIDLVIITLGWPVFGNVDAVLFGLAAAFVTSAVINKIMYGAEAGTLLIIITEDGMEAARRIGNAAGRGSTAVRAIGTYTGDERDVLLCACSKAQAYSACRAVHELDENAFIMMTETNQVFGQGFTENRGRS